MTFPKDIEKWIRKTKASEDKVIQKVCLEISSSIILRTPVDTGRARGNWEASIGTPSSKTTESLSKSGQSAIRKASALSKDAPGSKFFLVNNLPYIKKLEEGSSGQAPAGMVAVTIAAFKNIVKRLL